MSEQEISISKDSITFKGEVVDDLRKPIKTLANTADSVLRLAGNVVGLPADFLSYHLETFRDKYLENYQSIPDENKCSPNLRISCSVLKNVAYSAEEPEIQALFASLLASASDKELLGNVQPGFATVINEMTSLDSKVLLDFHIQTTKSKESRIEFSNDEKQLISQSRSNLIRLGLLELTDREYSQQEINTFMGKQNFNSPRNANEVNKVLVDLINDLQKFKNNVAKDRISSTNRQKLDITQFGKTFLAVVYKKQG